MSHVLQLCYFSPKVFIELIGFKYSPIIVNIRFWSIFQFIVQNLINFHDMIFVNDMIADIILQ